VKVEEFEYEDEETSTAQILSSFAGIMRAENPPKSLLRYACSHAGKYTEMKITPKSLLR
jgi:hypothetical protein